MDRRNPVTRKQRDQARRRLQRPSLTTTTTRARHTSQPTGGGVSARDHAGATSGAETFDGGAQGATPADPASQTGAPEWARWREETAQRLRVAGESALAFGRDMGQRAQGASQELGRQVSAGARSLSASAATRIGPLTDRSHPGAATPAEEVESANGAGAAGADMPTVRSRPPRFSRPTRPQRDPLARPTTWLLEPSWYERFHNWLADAMPFGWRERARHYGFWRRRLLPLVALLVCLALAIGVGLFAFNAAGRAAGSLAKGAQLQQSAPGGGVIISPQNNADLTPTPVAPAYTVGVWVSNTLPQGNSVTVFVSVSHNAMPQPGAKVFVTANTPQGTIPLGPLVTDSYGVAQATLNYGNVGSTQPIYLSATTSEGGQTFDGQYTFVTY